MKYSITICIPTYNRPLLLRRLLKFYEKTAPNFQIFIGDANTNTEHKKNLKFIKSLQNAKNISILHHPKKNYNNVIETEQKILGLIKTKYVVFCPDDDIQIPSTLIKMYDILETDNSIIGMIGKGLLFDPKNNYYSDYRLNGFMQEKPSQRLYYYLRNYCGILFSLFRTDKQFENFKSIYPSVDVIQNELYPSCNVPILGKVKAIDRVQLLRPMGGQDRYKMTEIKKTNRFLDKFYNVLTNNILKNEDLNIDEVKKNIEILFSKTFLNQNLIYHLSRRLFYKIKSIYYNKLNKKYFQRKLNDKDILYAIELVKKETIQQ